jgi:hypothetical protein
LVKTDVVASVSVEGIEYPLGLVLQGVIAGVGGRQPRPPVYCLQHLPDAQLTVVGDPERRAAATALSQTGCDCLMMRVLIRTLAGCFFAPRARSSAARRLRSDKGFASSGDTITDALGKAPEL